MEIRILPIAIEYFNLLKGKCQFKAYKVRYEAIYEDIAKYVDNDFYIGRSDKDFIDYHFEVLDCYFVKELNIVLAFVDFKGDYCRIYATDYNDYCCIYATDYNAIHICNLVKKIAGGVKWESHQIIVLKTWYKTLIC